MRIRLFGWELVIEKEPEPSDFEFDFNCWYCPDCKETGQFLTLDGFVQSGAHDWRTYPEMRCECRRHYEEASR